MPVVLQAKFAAWLSWSQPFVHRLVTGLDPYVRNVVLCNRTEQLGRFPVKEICRLPQRFLFQPSLTTAAAVHLRERYAPDLIHAHFGWSGLRALLLKQMLGVPLVVTFGGRDLGLQSTLPAFGGAYQALFDSADSVICVSQDLATRAAAVGIPEERIHTIYRGTDLSQFDFVDRRSRGSDAPLRILMVSRLTAKKGHPDALRALRRMIDAGDQAILTIVGEGQNERAVRKLIGKLALEPHVHLLGSTDHSGVRRHMAEADVLLHPSVETAEGDVEGVPNVVVEAHATGLPVVGTRHGGIPEVVVQDETGEIVEERDTDALAIALSRLARDRDRRLKLGEAAHRRAHAHFDMNLQFEAHASIYQELTERARADASGLQWNGLPSDILDRLRPITGLSGPPSEYSLAELLDQVTSSEDDKDPYNHSLSDEIEREETTLDRIYSWKSAIPTHIKYPVKRLVSRVIMRAISARGDHRREVVSPAEIAREERVLAHFLSGGGLPVGGDPSEAVSTILKGADAT